MNKALITILLVLAISIPGIAYFMRIELLTLAITGLAQSYDIHISDFTVEKFTTRELNVSTVRFELGDNQTPQTIENLHLNYSPLERKIEKLSVASMQVNHPVFHNATPEPANANAITITDFVKRWRALPIDTIQIDTVEYGGHQMSVSFDHQPDADQLVLKEGNKTLFIKSAWQAEKLLIDTVGEIAKQPILVSSTRLTLNGPNATIAGDLTLDIGAITAIPALLALLPSHISAPAGKLAMSFTTTVNDNPDEMISTPLDLTLFGGTAIELNYGLPKNSALNTHIAMSVIEDVTVHVDDIKQALAMQAGFTVTEATANIALTGIALPYSANINLLQTSCSSSKCITDIKLDAVTELISVDNLSVLDGKLNATLQAQLDNDRIVVKTTVPADFSANKLSSLESSTLDTIHLSLTDFDLSYNFDTQHLSIPRLELNLNCQAGNLFGKQYQFKQLASDIELQHLNCSSLKQCKGQISSQLNAQSVTTGDSIITNLALTTLSNIILDDQQLTFKADNPLNITAKSMTQQVNNLTKPKLFMPTFEASYNFADAKMRLSSKTIDIDFDRFKNETMTLRSSLKLSELLMVSSDNNTNISGTFKANSIQLDIPDTWVPRLNTNGRFLWHKNDVLVDGSLYTNKEKKLLDYDIEHNLSDKKGKGYFQSAHLSFDNQYSKLSNYFSKWPFPMDVVNGEYHGNATVNWYERWGEFIYHAKTEHKLINLSGYYNNMVWFGLGSTITGTLEDNNFITHKPISLAIDTLDVGFPIYKVNLSGHINTAESLYYLQSADAKMLGGKVMAYDYIYSERPPAELPLNPLPLLVYIDSLQLAEIFELAALDAVTGTGSLSGSLPIHINNGVATMDGGYLRDNGPGTIHYRADSATSENSSLKAVYDIMENYHFDTLRSGAKFDKDGILSLVLKLEGKNPHYSNGQQANLNLNLTYPTAGVLAAKRATRLVTDIIDNKINRYSN